jgi:hypothetical protein
MPLFEDVWDYTWAQFYYGKPFFQVVQNITTAQSIPSGTATLVNWDLSNVDSWSGFNLNADQYNVPVAGWYRITAQITWNGNGTGQRYAAVWQNGSLVTTGIVDRRANTSTISCCPDCLIQCAVGDSISLHVYQDSGSAQPIFNNSSYQATFSGIWVHA